MALATFLRATIEFRQQGRLKRADQFFALRERMKSDRFAHLAELLDEANSADPDLRSRANQALTEQPFSVRRDYVGLFEEVAISMNSRLIVPSVAHYMFGYYAILCWKSDAFWDSLNKGTPYWSIMREFCRTMAHEEERLVRHRRSIIGRRRYRF